MAKIPLRFLWHNSKILPISQQAEESLFRLIEILILACGLCMQRNMGLNLDSEWFSTLTVCLSVAENLFLGSWTPF